MIFSSLLFGSYCMKLFWPVVTVPVMLGLLGNHFKLYLAGISRVCVNSYQENNLCVLSIIGIQTFHNLF